MQEELEQDEMVVSMVADAAPVDVAELERRVVELEGVVASLREVQAAAASEVRRTLGAPARLMAKGGEPVAAGAVDAALTSLSPEQRFAVKAGLMRAGLI